MEVVNQKKKKDFLTKIFIVEMMFLTLFSMLLLSTFTKETCTDSKNTISEHYVRVIVNSMVTKKRVADSDVNVTKITTTFYCD